MARKDGIRRGPRRNFSGLLVTAALHGCILLAVAKAHEQPVAPLIVQRDFVQAEMVKLGKPRDKFWLPRITQPPPPTAPEGIKISDNPNAKPAEAPKPEDPKISKDLKRALERARKLESLAVPEEPEEGARDGAKLGTSNRAVGDPYSAQIAGMLQELFKLPAGMTLEQVPNPPEIKFKIGTDGTVSDVKLLKGSGNPLIDDACVRAAQEVGKVPPPPATIRGIRVECQK